MPHTSIGNVVISPPYFGLRDYRSSVSKAGANGAPCDALRRTSRVRGEHTRVNRAVSLRLSVGTPRPPEPRRWPAGGTRSRQPPPSRSAAARSRTRHPHHDDPTCGARVGPRPSPPQHHARPDRRRLGDRHGAGPLLCSVRIVRTINDSRIAQDLELPVGSRRLAVRSDIDRQERDAMLKAAWPQDVHAEHEGAEIQFGHVRRPTHADDLASNRGSLDSLPASP
ncbi:glycoside hydrolase family 38 C-terminal domain-containing protein [Sphaerisporangium album]|uniref:glycoside hydrolase family 38 C-terminal domain-containing protein n=1 Tax=Sphaerisporangium album TaxID=509200 RepID=UPI0024823D54|nr:glycoside hydrolase family 38 C-terminal domain-containing protein [Sphaerisporangium album]